MKKIIILLVIIVSIGLFAGCVKGKVEEQPEINDETNKDDNQTEVMYAPDFELESLDGDKIKLSDLKGKKVIINFWATWCKYCEEEMPDLQKLYDNYKDEDLVILAIDVGESKNKVQKFIDENNLTFTVLLDSKSIVARNYGINSFPTSIAIDEEGIVVTGHIGMMNYEQMEEMYNYLKK